MVYTFDDDYVLMNDNHVLVDDYVLNNDYVLDNGDYVLGGDDFYLDSLKQHLVSVQGVMDCDESCCLFLQLLLHVVVHLKIYLF